MPDELKTQFEDSWAAAANGVGMGSCQTASVSGASTAADSTGTQLAEGLLTESCPRPPGDRMNEVLRPARCATPPIASAPGSSSTRGRDARMCRGGLLPGEWSCGDSTHPLPPPSNRVLRPSRGLSGGVLFGNSRQALGFSTPRRCSGSSRALDRHSTARSADEIRLLSGLETTPDAARELHWLVATDRLDLKLAYRGVGPKFWRHQPRCGSPRFCANLPSALHVHYGPPGSGPSPDILARKLALSADRQFPRGGCGHRTAFTEPRLSRARYSRLFRDATASHRRGAGDGRSE